jgi:hypothetical protein
MDGMCVADGVGGWARSGKGGADAGRWSRLLTHFCEKEVDEWWKGAPEYLSSAGKGNSADSEAGKPKERRRIRLSIGGGGGGGADLSGGWAQKVWKAGERAKEGMMREESRRRPLDPVEIMQRGYEKCLSCFLKEVSESCWDDRIATDSSFRGSTVLQRVCWRYYTTRRYI